MSDPVSERYKPRRRFHTPGRKGLINVRQCQTAFQHKPRGALCYLCATRIAHCQTVSESMSADTAWSNQSPLSGLACNNVGQQRLVTTEWQGLIAVRHCRIAAMSHLCAAGVDHRQCQIITISHLYALSVDCCQTVSDSRDESPLSGESCWTCSYAGHFDIRERPCQRHFNAHERRQ